MTATHLCQSPPPPSLFTQEEMGGIPLEDVLEAYFECRRKKRNTYNALAFEREYERHCVQLWQEINSGSYRPSRSIAFVVERPVRREVFAADFRDRVVHHLIARRILPLLERRFVDSNYSTRKGRGTLYGIRDMERHIRLCSQDYTRDCYIMKLDVRSFFMRISKRCLYERIESILKSEYDGDDLHVLLFLLRRTVFHRPERNCIRKSPSRSWKDLPRDKSLFGSDGSCGLPIGNLTSQLLALTFLDELDHLVLERWGIKHYGRYVDDMVLVHPDKRRLLEVKELIGGWLSERGLSLHPRKFYLQHYAKGVLFIGGMLLPGRRYISRRTLGFCLESIGRMNRAAETDPGYVAAHAESFVSTVNSYLGMMGHFASYNLRRRVMLSVGPQWWQAVYFSGHIGKAVLKRAFNPRRQRMESVMRKPSKPVQP